MSGDSPLNEAPINEASPISSTVVQEDRIEVVIDLTVAEREAEAKAAIAKRAGRIRGYAIVTALYALATIAGLVTVLVMKSDLWLEVLVADVVATVVVFVASVITNNSSMYDPYWSVAPALFAVGMALTSGSGANTARVVLLTLVVLAWAVRLTYNWGYGWQGMPHEDWRYRKLKTDTGNAYWFVSFSGIHLFPTIMVYLGMLPFFVAYRSGRSISALDIAGTIVALAATALEGLADVQMHCYRKAHPKGDSVADTGLWSVSRHPNYLGEILFWVGVSLIGLAAAPREWWRLGGVLMMLVLFLGISIPLIEKRHLERKGEKYVAYQRRTPMLFPSFIRKTKRT
jgi:steroid 5-alpha reductase family enzyme